MLPEYPEPFIKYTDRKQLTGKKVSTSLLHNRTGELWKNFMPLRKQIKGVVGNELYSLQQYPKNYFENFNPATEFVKWAAVEISNEDDPNPELERLILPAGLYAVFHYKGSAMDNSIFQYIYTQWLPRSGYELDDRPHFEVLGEKYKNADPGSEEDIWIPVKQKAS